MVSRPDDAYSAVPSVAPSTSSGNDLNSVRSNPSDFGAQVGQSVQGAGQVADKQFAQETDLAIQRQGQINETLANQADMDFTIKGGEIYNKYKNLTGLDAVAGRQQAVQDYTALRDKVRAGLPSDASRRAFDQVSTRTTAFTIKDMDGYAATEQKKAHTNSLLSSAQLALDSTNRPEVATDMGNFGYALGTMKSQLAGAFTSDEGYASVTHMDNKGNITFDPTDQGKMAETAWTAYYNKYLGKAWENRESVLASTLQGGDIRKAVADLEANREKIPADAYARISALLSNPYKNIQLADVANRIVSTAETNYDAHIAGTPNNLGAYSPESFTQNPTGTLKSLLGVDVTVNSNIRTPEHNAAVGGVPNSEHLTGNAWDFTPEGLSTHDAAVTLANRLKAQGVKFDQIIDEGGAVHVGFGPQNRGEVLARSGQNGNFKYNSLYVPPPKTGVGTDLGSDYVSKADYFEAHFGELSLNARKELEQRFPDRPDLVEEGVRKTQSQMMDIVHTERQEITANKDIVMSAIDGKFTNGKPLTKVEQLDNIPQVSDVWHKVQRDDPFSPTSFSRLISANSQGRAPTYGTDFWNNLSGVVNGKVTNPNQLMSVIDPTDPKHSPLTNTGFKVLNQMLQDQQTPEGKAFQQAEFNWLNGPDVRRAITATGSVPGAYTPDLDKKFDLFLMNVLPKIEEKRGRGVTSGQMFDPKSSEYVGDSLNQFKYNQADLMKNIMKNSFVRPTAPGQPATSPQFNPDNIKNRDDLFKAVQAGQVNRQKFNDIAKKLGLVQDGTGVPIARP